MRPLKVKISVSLDEDLVDELKVISEEADRSLSQYINLILKKHIEKIEEEIDEDI